jgi:methylated-DNA-[protein]-cysteine S-methyltransferase
VTQINIQYLPTAFGELILGSFQGKLCLCDWRFRKMRERVDARIKSLLDANYVLQTDDLITQTEIELNEYFKGKRQKFDVPVLLVGTDFQQGVWQQLQKVPYGETASYLQLAKELGDVKAIRAVATANGANALSIIVPCHRIIGSDGKLVGYAGGLDSKKRLLSLEANTAGVNGMRESLDLF